MAATTRIIPSPADFPASPAPAKSRRASKKNPLENEAPKVGKRGRPRVDPQDQSAAERRRTQIRLAQRAYRERKETTIAELEAKVQTLQSSLQQIRDAIVDFRTLATEASGQTWNASVSLALQDTVDRVVQLAGEADSEAKPEDEHRKTTPKRKRTHSPESAVEARKVDGTLHHENWLSSDAPPPPSRPAPWGYQWTYEDDSVIEVDQDLATVNESCSTWLEGTQALAAQPNRPVEPPVPIFTDGWLPTVGKELQPYHGYNLAETSWARRFHRFCYEHTYALLTNPAAPTAELHQKLRYSLCFGSVRMIAERIKWKLMRTTYEPMEMWDMPVLHIGNAGHNFPREGMDNSVPPPQGFAANYNMGPFQRRGHTTPPAEVYPYQVAQWLGIEGVWFDGYDVEQYLRTKGLFLNGWSTLATIEVDDAGRPITSDVGLTSPNGASTLTYSGPQSPSEEPTTDFFPPVMDSVLADVSTDANLGFDAVMDLDDPINAVIAPQKFGEEIATIMSSNPLVDMMGDTELAVTKRRQVTIDVDKLMREFYKRTICIGRSPGIKQDEVDEVLHSVIRESLDVF